MSDVDVFARAHARLRAKLSELLIVMGKARFGDPVEAEAVAARVESVVRACEAHLAHEEDVVFPVLLARLSGSLDSVDDAHAREATLAAELRALANGVVRMPRDKKRLGGRTLYLHYSRYVAEMLLHMAEEEQVVQPLLDRMFRDDELQDLTATLEEKEEMAC